MKTISNEQCAMCNDQQPRKMKDSGIEWIGEIPEVWDTIRFKYLHSQSNVGNSIDKEYWSSENEDTVFYTAGLFPIHTSYTDFPIEKYTSENDLLLARNGTPYVYFPVPDAVYSDHIIRVGINKRYCKRYIGYCLQQSINFEIVDTVSIATWSVSVWDKQFLCLPPIQEQQKIAAFLDHKCSEIDSVIEKTKATIEEYKSLKQSVITQAVTKGIRKGRKMKDSGDSISNEQCAMCNDSQPRKMKDSGIEWIGEIPEEWMLSKAKYYISVSNGSDPKTEGNIPVYGSGSKSFKTCGEYKEGPCVLIGRKGATLHIPHYIDHDYWNVDTAFDVKTKSGLNLKYYYYLACCFDYKFYISQTTLPGMTQTNYENIIIPIPALIEQDEIVSWIEVKTNKIDDLIFKKEQLLTELESYKKSVIYEYVTGKKTICNVQ